MCSAFCGKAASHGAGNIMSKLHLLIFHNFMLSGTKDIFDLQLPSIPLFTLNLSCHVVL